MLKVTVEVTEFKNPHAEKVRWKKIGVLKAVNIGQVIIIDQPDRKDARKYNWFYEDIEKQVTQTGSLNHFQSEGILKLIKEILDKVTL